MHRATLVVSVLALVLAGSVALGRAPAGTIAQDATPPPGEAFMVYGLPVGVPVEVFPGVFLQVLNAGMPAAAPGQNLLLYRFSVHPGAFIPDHIHPGTTLFTVEAGTFRWTLHRGTVWVTRGATASGTPAAPPERVTEPGTVIDLRPGDGLFYNDDVVHTAENPGDEPALLLVTVLFAADQPPITITDEHGTPVAAGTPTA